MSATLLSFPSSPSKLTGTDLLRPTASTPLLDLARGLLAERARHARDLSATTFAALVREWCDDAPTPLHREAILAMALLGAADAEVLGAMLSCSPQATSELLRWLRTLPIASPFDGSFAEPVRTALLARIDAAATPALEDARRRGAHALLERAASTHAAEALTALGDAVRLHRPGTPRATYTRLRDDELAAVEALVGASEGLVAATCFRVAYELAPASVVVRRDDARRIVGVAFAVRVDEAPPALRDADPALAAAALALAPLRARHSDEPGSALLVRSASAPSNQGDDEVFALAGAFLAATAAPEVRWVLGAAAREPSLAPIAIDLHALVGPGTSAETAARLARHHYAALVGARAPSSPSAGVPPPESALRAALLELRRPHRFAVTELARATPGGAPALRASIERACDALAREPGYADSARLLRATYFGRAQKQHAIAAELGLPFGTFRHHLRRAITELGAELATQASPARDLVRS